MRVCLLIFLSGFPLLCSQAADAFWSFDTWMSGDGAFTTDVTAHTFEKNPSLEVIGSQILNSGGAAYYAAFNGKNWHGSGKASTPGHSIAWSSGSRGNCLILTLDMSGYSTLAVRMDIRAFGVPDAGFTGIEIDTGNGFKPLKMDLPPFGKASDFLEWSITLSGSEIANQEKVVLKWLLPDVPMNSSIRMDNLELAAEE